MISYAFLFSIKRFIGGTFIFLLQCCLSFGEYSTQSDPTLPLFVPSRDVAENDLAGELLASFLKDNLRAYQDCLLSAEVTNTYHAW